MAARTHLRHALRSRDDRGAAALEFALVVVPLVMLLMGIVTFGLAYSNNIALTNAVREGARLGASTANTNAWGSAVVTQTVDAYADADNPLTTGDVCALLLRRNADATLTLKQSSSAACQGNPGDATPAGPVPANPDTSTLTEGCFVKVWAQRTADLNWILGRHTVTLKAQSVALYDRSIECPAPTP